jgi:hypothetical protein
MLQSQFPVGKYLITTNPDNLIGLLEVIEKRQLNITLLLTEL